MPKFGFLSKVESEAETINTLLLESKDFYS